MNIYVRMQKVVLPIVFLGLIAFVFYALKNVNHVHAEAVTVNCSGTAGSPTSVDEAALNGDNVTFADTGGDGFCTLDAAINAASVDVEAGVVITHVAGDVDGVNITTSGNFTLSGNINADAKGCLGTTNAGTGPNLSTGVCTAATSGYGKQYSAGAGHGNPGGKSKWTTGEGGSGGSRYGSLTLPTFFGSGGGGPGNGSQGGTGGGKIRLEVSGTLTVNGPISANAGNGDSDSGGGSGGSIYLSGGTIAGTTGSFSVSS